MITPVYVRLWCYRRDWTNPLFRYFTQILPSLMSIFAPQSDQTHLIFRLGPVSESESPNLIDLVNNCLWLPGRWLKVILTFIEGHFDIHWRSPWDLLKITLTFSEGRSPYIQRCIFALEKDVFAISPKGFWSKQLLGFGQTNVTLAWLCVTLAWFWMFVCVQFRGTLR